MSLLAEQVPGEKKSGKHVDNNEDLNPSPGLKLPLTDIPRDHPYRRPKL
jgi:hypothetical protein